MTGGFHVIVLALWIVPGFAQSPSYCGQTTFTAKTETITSPGFGSGQYGDSQSCSYRIESDPITEVVHLYINEFHLEYGYDFLYITEMTQSTSEQRSISELSGNLRPQLVMAKGFVVLDFTSDSDITKSGFRIDYVIYDDPCVHPSDNDCETEYPGNVCHYKHEMYYSCECDNPGFYKSGAACLDINECVNNDLVNAVNLCEQKCENTFAGYECDCNQGYRLLSNGFSCEDINQCIEDDMLCKTGNLIYGNAHGICINEQGGYHCDCLDGYSWHSREEVCVNIDECAMLLDSCEHECVDYSPIETGSKYQCKCRDGYHLASNGRDCLKKENCESSHPCDQICYDGVLGIQCSCDDGYKLSVDGVTCEEINECYEYHPCDHECVNQIPSVTGLKYYCTCLPGYYLHTDGHNCIDQDECSTSPCDQLCYNTVGSYRCECNPDYYLDVATGHCIRRTTGCSSMSYMCKNGGWCVEASGGQVRCSCPSGYSGYDCGIRDYEIQTTPVGGLSTNIIIIIVVFSVVGGILLIVGIVVVSWKLCRPHHISKQRPVIVKTADPTPTYRYPVTSTYPYYTYYTSNTQPYASTAITY